MEKVTVYKTDVNEQLKAQAILDSIRQKIPGCEVSIDLEDCDNVLRIGFPQGESKEAQIKTVLQQFGHQMEILP